MRSCPRCHPRRRPVARGPARSAGAARRRGSVPARRGRGCPAPDPDPGVVARRPAGSAAGPGARQELQAVRLWAGRLARWAPGLGAGRRPPRRPAVRPAAPRRGAFQGPRQDRHGDLGQPRHPHPQGSRLLRALLAELGEQLVLVYTPTYDPDANRIEWLWRSLRRTVTHTHRRQSLAELVADADRWARTITPAQVLRQIGSPFAPDQQPTISEELDHAA